MVPILFVGCFPLRRHRADTAATALGRRLVFPYHRIGAAADSQANVERIHELSLNLLLSSEGRIPLATRLIALCRRLIAALGGDAVHCQQRLNRMPNCVPGDRARDSGESFAGHPVAYTAA